MTMAEKIPFDEDTMTLIMGLGGPEEPGQHGRKMIPAPENDAIDVITQIRDLCEDFLKTTDKGEESESEETEMPEKAEESEE
jgi:hypothetical protein